MAGAGRKLGPAAALLVALAVCSVAVAGCLLLYVFDNKYTAGGPQAHGGVLLLDDDALTQHPTVFLVEGWEYYGGRLLTPDDLAQNAPAPDAYIYIGQYGGFEAGDWSSSPHGSASYRLRILLPAQTATYLLELPEIFSAYRLYVNGQLAATMGNPDTQDYYPETKNSALSIEAGGEIELLFAVSDHSHFYSGMVYPPSFGRPQAVSSLLDTRLVFRSLLSAFALAIGLVAILTSLLSGKNVPAMLYGLLCLFFVGCTSYPVVHTLITGRPWHYAVEMASFCAMLATVVLLQWVLNNRRPRWGWACFGFGMAMCCFVLLRPVLLPDSALWLLAVYSWLIFAFELVTAGFITVIALRGIFRQTPHSIVLLCGFLLFDTALVMDRLLPLYEPIVTGWFYELASFGLLLCVGATVGQEMAAKYRENAVLTERQSGMERLAQMQKASYALLMEKVDDAKVARHDLRHHLMMIDGFLESGEYGRLADYVAEYRAAIPQGDLASYTQNAAADVLLRHYAGVARQQGIQFTAHARLEQDIAIPDADLCALLSNLLENAVEACARVKTEERSISITLTQKGLVLSFHMENSASGAPARQGSGFASAKQQGRTGYGLASITSIARRHSGSAAFSYDADTGVFVSTVILTC